MAGDTASAAESKGWRLRYSRRMSSGLFKLADFLGRPPGFYVVLILMIISTGLLPFGYADLVTYGLSVAAIIITGVVLIQGFRDTAAIHAKLDEIVLSLKETRNSVIGLEHSDPDEIEAAVQQIESEAEHRSQTLDVGNGVDTRTAPTQGVA